MLLVVPADGVVADAAGQFRVVLLQPALQRIQPGHTLGGVGVRGVRVAVRGCHVSRYGVVRQRLAHVDEAAPLLIGPGQQPVVDLQRGDALAGVVAFKLVFLRHSLQPRRRSHRAIAIAQQHDEEGAAAFDLGKAHFEHAQLAFFFGGKRHQVHAQPQVDGLQPLAARAQGFFQAREYLGAQPVALGLHVRERGTDEDRLSSPAGGNGDIGVVDHRGAPSLQRD